MAQRLLIVAFVIAGPISGFAMARSGQSAAPILGPAALCHTHDGLPDRQCTPGVRDRRVTQANIDRTICRRGYSTRVRPPTSYTGPLKLRQMRAYGYYAGRRPSVYEEDHLISLELGGSPTSPRNLWPQAHYPRPGSYTKDGEENILHRKVCNGEETLRQAQRDIATNWLRAYRRDHTAR